MRKFKCIGLEENIMYNWAWAFVIGDVYEETKHPRGGMSEGELYLYSGEYRLTVNSDQFVEVKP